MTACRIDELLVDVLTRRKVLGAWAVISAMVHLLPSPAVVRGVVILPFLLVCPGAAIVGHLRLRDVATDIALSVGVSLSLEVVVALAFLYGGHWSSDLVFAVIVAICLIAIAVDRFRDPQGTDVQVHG